MRGIAARSGPAHYRRLRGIAEYCRRAMLDETPASVHTANHA